MNASELLIQKRILELAEKSYSRGCYTFTDFLGLAEQNILLCTKSKLPCVPYTLFGGAEGCERVMLRFGSEEFCGYVEDFPIDCLRIEPLSHKFAGRMSHRDFLGALMNLGLERDVLGDIAVRGDTAYVFAISRVAPFIVDNLDRVGRTAVRCERVPALPEGSLYTLERRECLAASLRVDGVAAHALGLSRSDVLELVRAGKVFINGKAAAGSEQLCPNDTVSVRGCGRFIYRETLRQTKSGKLCLAVDFYV